MSNDQLKNTLKDLHLHLEATGSVDTELKTLLQALDQDIHHLLSQAPPADADADTDEGGLADRAQELSAKFAAQHPQLEKLLRELGSTLERMGI